MAKKEKQVCDFNIKKFNLKKRIAEAAGGPAKGRRPPKGGTVGTPGSGGTVLLEFYGFLVSGTSWNASGDINCAHSGLTADEVTAVTTKITNYFNPYNVVVTLDDRVYNNTAINKRQRVIFTESWEWYGQAGGVAFLNSFTWNDDTPCFVFTSLLGYSTHRIADAGAHEAGHTMGLRHQVSCVDGVMVNQYNWGDGINAPIMGASYNVPLGSWWIGPSTMGCTSVQNDNLILTTLLGLKV